MRSSPAAPSASRTQFIVRVLAGVLLVGGAALALWALTLPWHHFEPPSGLGLPADPHIFIPAQDYAQSPPTILGALYVCPPIALGVFGLIELLRPRLLWRTRVIAGLALAIVGLMFSFLLMASSGFLNDSVYRYVLDGGANVSYLGYVFALVGSSLSVPLPTRSQQALAAYSHPFGAR